MGEHLDYKTMYNRLKEDYDNLLASYNNLEALYIALAEGTVKPKTDKSIDKREINRKMANANNGMQEPSQVTWVDGKIVDFNIF